VKNTDFLIYLRTKGGSITRFSRDEEGCTQRSPAGIERRCTAEQVLNHLLPALALGGAVVETKVELKRGRRFHHRLEELKLLS